MLPESFDHGPRGPDNQFARHPTLSVTGEQLRDFMHKHRVTELPNVVYHADPECGRATLMGEGIAATLAIEPGFYPTLFCAPCKRYVERSNFRWYHSGEKL